ncbi:inorganic phosphate transporter [Thelephora terrestris]|uniref:Inorganic phosphate transporter n=1 Tax=Thelephora terrestris TaxID=56493 RepID=A0A9P6HLI0_9AGAM|nr:inorganic phosphate transporter [Thelephora terrestris]
MNAATSNLAISLLVMQIARKIPFDDPEVLLYARIGYVSAQVIVLVAYFVCSSKIKQKNDLTVLKYVEPKSPLSQESGNLVITTVKDYDLGEVSKGVKGVYTGLAMMTFLHLYLNYTQPLFIQAIMALKNLYDSKPVKIHIFGEPAEGELKRPFKAGGLFGAAGSPETDKAAVDEAEKRIGAKKED